MLLLHLHQKKILQIYLHALQVLLLLSELHPQIPVQTHQPERFRGTLVLEYYILRLELDGGDL